MIVRDTARRTTNFSAVAATEVRGPARQILFIVLLSSRNKKKHTVTASIAPKNPIERTLSTIDSRCTRRTCTVSGRNT